MKLLDNLNTSIMRFATVVTVIAILSEHSASNAADREQIRIVGSSTIYPFSAAVAKKFGATTRFQTPAVQSTGSGGGHKLFGAGMGPDTADIANSSRKMTVQEFERARNNGVTNITEAVIGYDGIAIAENVRNQPITLTRTEIALAVAAEVPDPVDGKKLVANPYTYWDEINDRLPHRRIKVYGPPTTSGTRDAFEELCIEAATESIKAYKGNYAKIRNDGVWVDFGENDDLIVERLTQDNAAFGVFGFSFLEKNREKIQGVAVDGVEAEFETIASGEYPLSRSLYFYIKSDHMKHIPGMYEYVRLFMGDEMIGENGQLAGVGLVPLPSYLREASRDRVLKLTPLRLSEGKLDTLADYARDNRYVKK